MGLSSVSALHSAVWVAEQKGLFRKHGLDPKIIVTGQSATAGIGGLLANDIQIASAGGDSLVNAAFARRRHSDDRGRRQQRTESDFGAVGYQNSGGPQRKEGWRESHWRGLSLGPSDDAQTLEHEPNRPSGSATRIVTQHVGGLGQGRH